MGSKRGQTGAGGRRDTATLPDLQSLRMITDPLRMRLLTLADSRPVTVKELADGMGLSPDRLYYHVRLLEEAGLLEAQPAAEAEKLPAGGGAELPARGRAGRRYRTAHRQLGLARSATDSPERASELADAVFSGVQKQVRAALRADYGRGTRPTYLSRSAHRLTPSAFGRLAARLQAVIAEEAAALEAAAIDPTREPAEAPMVYSALVALYPMDNE